ncbi:MAG TPA: chemotaxis protein CheW [Nitrospirota bacterium]|nr:chemotaxis protein CheW [Nitrospirota bacterium]
MDILAARKKAAEKAQSRDKPEKSPVETQTGETGEALRTDEGGAVSAGPAQAPLAPEAAAPAADHPLESPETPPGDESVAAPAQEMEMLSFRLGGEEYAVMVDDVREVLKLRDLTVVPNAPDYILGVISLRGTMLPIMDLCKRFGIESGARDEKSRIVVVNPDEEEVGLMVDRVTGVFKIMPDAIKPTPENIERGAEFLRGIVRKEDKLYILLDLVKAVGV